MSAPVPPMPPINLANPQIAAAQVVAAVVAEIPEALLALPTGTTFDAVVTGSPGRGLVTLSTEAGTITARLAGGFAEGSKLTLQLSSVGAQTTLRLLALDGRQIGAQPAPQGGGGNQPGMGLPQPPLGAVAIGAGALSGIPGSLTATVVAPAPQAGGQAQPGLAVGTTLGVRIASVQPPPAAAATPPGQAQLLPAGPPAAGPAAGPPAGPSGMAPPAAPPAAPTVPAPPAAPAAAPLVPAPPAPAPPAGPPPAAPAGPQAPPQAGAQPAPAGPWPWQGAPYGSAPQAKPQAHAAAQAGPAGGPPVPAVLNGAVAANNHAGQTLVQTPVGVLAIPASPHLTPGVRVALEVVSVTPPAAQSAVASAQVAAVPPSGAFPALGEAMELLARFDPAAAERLADGLPQANGRLAANMLVFAAALRSNAPRAAFGEQPLKALERVGGREAVKRLTEELAEKAGHETKPTPGAGGEWRVVTIPFLSGAEIDPIRLSLRRPPDADETVDEAEKKSRGEPGARFLVDLSLTRIGPVQLDGLVKRKAKRFDLILRTRTALDGDTRAAVGRIFACACAELQMAGQVTFQATTRFVEPLLPERAVRGLTV